MMCATKTAGAVRRIISSFAHTERHRTSRCYLPPARCFFVGRRRLRASSPSVAVFFGPNSSPGPVTSRAENNNDYDINGPIKVLTRGRNVGNCESIRHTNRPGRRITAAPFVVWDSSSRTCRRRCFSSSRNERTDFGGDGEERGETTTTTTTTTATTPLSDVSNEDLDLAMRAAVEAETSETPAASSMENGTKEHQTTPSLQEQHEQQPSSQDYFADIPGTSKGSGRKLAIVYTCKVCGTRSAKRFTERAYQYGVVIVRCPGCQNLHLIADRLGFFAHDDDDDEEGGGWDIEKAMAKMGEQVLAVTNDNVLELTVRDVLGSEKMDEVLTTGDRNTDSGDGTTVTSGGDDDRGKSV